MVSLLLTLWGANGYVSAFGRAMNRVFDVAEGVNLKDPLQPMLTAAPWPSGRDAAGDGDVEQADLIPAAPPRSWHARDAPDERVPDARRHGRQPADLLELYAARWRCCC